MQRFILTILITCNIGTGLETSSDIEDVLMEEGFALNADLSGDHPEGEDIDGDDCDHCCHASAHVVAFVEKQQALSHHSATNLYGVLSQLHGRTGRAPPNPPPIV